MQLEKILKEEIVENREFFHQIPELGFKEFKTSKYIFKKLKEYGFQVEKVAGTGVIGFRKGTDPGDSTIAFRADMDALALREKTGLAYSSKIDNRMHACGHDGHMAILLGLGRYISELDEIGKNILLIFQPAEEGPGGAEIIVRNRVLKKYSVESIFGLHIHPSVDEGKLAVNHGPIMAECGEINVRVRGKGGHGAMPEKGIDSIYVASQLINSYQSIISRNIEAVEGGVISIGKIAGGEARNILAEEVVFEGTIRAYREEVYETIKSRIAEINRGFELTYGVEIEGYVDDMYPAVVNDFKLYNRIIETFDEAELEVLKPMMIAEDFSYYQREIPGFFLILGSRNEERGHIYPLHHCKFNFDEDVLYKGVETFVRISEMTGVVKMKGEIEKCKC